MTGYIPEEIINDLRHRVDIIDVIKDYVPLKKQGQNFTGLCPFHAEKTPSFVVSPHKQIYHCFGCGKGGNVFSFLMDKNGINFPEAVQILAQRYGVALPQKELTLKETKENSLRKRYYHINELTAKFYQKELDTSHGKEALAYLEKRGLKQETRQKFLLGYAPPGWDQLSRFLFEEGFCKEELLKLGLAVETKKGNLIDYFRNRIIFPIMNEGGNIIGFGGRVLDHTQPKYLNSPDTPLFNKGKFLYGLHLAKGSIRNQEKVILMEGYMDVITAFQNKIENVVGTLGTALTLQQAQLLMRYTNKAYLCFDADSAGEAAVLRGVDVLQQVGSQVFVITILEGKDPDEYIRSNGQEAFLQLINKAEPFIEYKLKQLMRKKDYDSTQGKIEIIQELTADIQKITSPVARQAFIQLVSDKLAFSENAIHAELRKEYNRDDNRFGLGDRDKKGQQAIFSAVKKAERTLIRLILDKPEIFAEVKKWGGKELLQEQLLKEIYQAYDLIHQAGHNIKADELITLLENREAQQLLAEILLEDDDLPEGWQRVYKDCLITLALERIDQKINEKKSQMSYYEEAGEVSKSIELMAQIQQMVKDRMSFTATLRKGGG